VAADGGAEPWRNLRCTAQCLCGRCRSRLMPVLQPTQFPACMLVGPLAQRLRHAGRAALVRQRQHLDLQPLLAPADLQLVARAQRLGRLAAAAVDVDLAAVDRLLGETARLEEARGPQPHVDAYFGGWVVVQVIHGWHCRRIADAITPQAASCPAAPSLATARCLRRARCSPVPDPARTRRRGWWPRPSAPSPPAARRR